MASTEPKFGRELKAWRVENQTGQETKLFEITDTNVKQSVHVIKCSDITVIVKGKVGEILLDQCKKVTLQFDAALGSCNIVNSTKCHVHMVDGTPCVQIDRSNGTEVYLSKDSEANTNILTSGSTETSVYSAPLEAHGDGVEFHVPQQFTSKMVGGRLVTAAVQHGRY